MLLLLHAGLVQKFFFMLRLGGAGCLLSFWAFRVGTYLLFGAFRVGTYSKVGG